ncbi:MAG TPA: hypothetical protein VFO93_04565 [Hymenobacter sp.]|uniref:hypothetical protein n=1 Tax=Hymenobacter sp. TaxID=1898978 RepID=UPI002D7F3A69|nr:hypothetical protein [Hymenobacter sp.]HET9502788.1 hypothetical protein [Hymenobacter sp.]
MKASLFTFCAVAILLQLNTSCINTEREVATSTKDPRSVYVPPSSTGRRVSGATVLNTVRASHAFSDPKTKDNFVLQLRGPRILTSRVHLIVLSAQGDTLRHEVMPARALLAGSTAQDSKMATVRDQEIAILRRMNNFFAEDHFTRPAVPGTAAQPAELDAKAWDSLRADPNAIGFDYPGAAGNDMRLAYSRQLRRAVAISQ